MNGTGIGIRAQLSLCTRRKCYLERERETTEYVITWHPVKGLYVQDSSTEFDVISIRPKYSSEKEPWQTITKQV